MNFDEIVLSRQKFALTQGAEKSTNVSGKLVLSYANEEDASDAFVKFMRENLGCSQNGTVVTVHFDGLKRWV